MCIKCFNITCTLSMSIVDLGEFFPGDLPERCAGYTNELFGNG